MRLVFPLLGARTARPPAESAAAPASRPAKRRLRPAAPRGDARRLFDAVLAPELLAEAWRKVRSNGGGPGGDGETLEAFARRLDRRLAGLAADLRSSAYRPGPLRHVAIPKPGGGERRLAIPPVVDRVAQTALLLAIVPHLDRRMAEESFAYRPGRSVAQALALARGIVAGGGRFVLDADIERFFDSVPHRPLLSDLAIWLEDARLISLVAMWLSAWAPSGKGLAQGAPLSPLLANLYLHPLDRLLAAAGIAAVRYADDFLAFGRQREEAERALRIAGGALADRGLRLNPEKTRILPASADIVFLGEPLLALPAAPSGHR